MLGEGLVAGIAAGAWLFARLLAEERGRVDAGLQQRPQWKEGSVSARS